MPKSIEDLIPAAVVLLGSVAVAFVFHFMLSRPRHLLKRRAFLRSVLVLLSVVAGVIGVLLTLPIGETLRIQLLTILGIIVSAIITLSSTTFVGNAMAGFMLRALRKFSVGDYIRVDEQFGRVSEVGIFQTEIQTEESNLVTLPNLYLVTKPLTVVRTSGTGTVISATVSLGYDVPHRKIEKILTRAAAQTGLGEPFVQILELSDFSVNYRCAGLLTDAKKLLAASSLLRRNMLDMLHDGGIEIVSPTFMNQRVFATDRAFIPAAPEPTEPEEKGPAPVPKEEVLFDKAEKAASVEELRAHLEKLEKHRAEIHAALKESKGDAHKERYKKSLKRLQEYVERVEARIVEAEKADDDS
jgi:small-conductance mechanosensitive channel